MDFFASQDLARRKTRWLIIYFILALVCMVIAIYALVQGVLFYGNERFASSGGFELFNPMVFGVVAVSVLTLVGLGSLVKVAGLRGGGESVAAMLGGRHLPPNATDPAERRILNVVEEMALAAGTPVPPVYVLDNEAGINAFAAGYTVDDAVIGINRGTIEQLNRDELQGVVAHEFSHILNGDMRMNIRMIGLLFGIQLLALVGYYVLRGSAFSGRRSSNDKGGAGAIILIALGLVVIGSIGMFFAKLIKASVSRQREYLADASAVQFTRNPEGIAGALKMIALSAEGSKMKSPQAEEASHMFFGSMYAQNFFNAFATHPPLIKRIQRLEPRFDGNFMEYRKERGRRRQRQEAASQPAQPTTAQGRFPRIGRRAGFPGMMGDRFPLDPAILIAGIGLPDDDDVEYSEYLVDQLPPELGAAARDLFSARCLVFASLLNDDPTTQREQVEGLARREGPATIREIEQLLPNLRNLEPRFRLPLFEILQGSLTAMSPEQYSGFRESVEMLVLADDRVDLFEFFLRHHLLVHLDRRFGLRKPPRVQYRNVMLLREDITKLLWILVQVGHVDRAEAASAYKAALDSLGVDWGNQPFDEKLRISHRELADALERLNTATPKIKKDVLSAAALAITHDNQVTVQEAELFRAMSESLDCPVPPVVASAPDGALDDEPPA